LKDTQSRYEFFVKKWKAIIDLLQNPKERGPRDVIARLKTEGATAGNWEATRDFEFFEAVSVREKELFLRVYFGTPHESYRKRVYKIYHPDFRIPSHFDWLVSIPGGERATHTVALVPDVPEMTPRKFDLEKGCEIGGKAMLAQHPLLLNLLRLLCRDFYRPIPLGTLVSELYPDEYYNPVTSPEKAHRAVKRLRIWFKENDIPLTVTLKNNAFRLLATGPYIVSTTMKHELVGKNEAYLERLKAHFGSQTFNAKSAAEILDVSINTALKFLRWSVEGKKILQLAGGRSTKYKLAG
jgi:hypothetical protein